MSGFVIAGLLVAMLLVIAGAVEYGQTSNPPPRCNPGAVAVHYGTDGAWACVLLEGAS